MIDILAIQRGMQAAGYDPGELDGEDGPNTRRALAQLEADLKRLFPLKPSRPAAILPAGDPASMNAFYGNPDKDGNGYPDPEWERANLVLIEPPYRMVLAWNTAQAVKHIKVHRAASYSLIRVMSAIKAHYGSQDAIEAARMHLYGGCYNFRLKRGGSTLSTHSWGAAIDLDPERNAFGKKYSAAAGMMPEAVIKIFQSEKWVWGGKWAKPDAMHFEATS